jgi:cellulose synthase/poly-beta-1,6-N-acetylglucosamine synthase-like glycosyltransferase
MNPVFNGAVYLVWFLATYYIVFFFLVLFTRKNDLYESNSKKLITNKLVSIIVPSYNEEETMALTIKSLKKVSYSNVEFLIISDGSTDNTAKEASKAIGNDKRFKFIDRKENLGKAATINQGIALAKGEYIAEMDADSMVEPKIIEKVLHYFTNPKVGAVTVSILVHSPKKFLHKVVDLEFIIGLSLFLKVFSFFNCVQVTPGPFSMYRAKVLKEIGGFDEDNITEDLEIAYRIHKAGYIIENCMEAKVHTTVPPTFKSLFVQRRRWYSGAIQTLFQHKNVMFNKNLGMFGFWVPFNFLLIFSGLALALTSTYITLSNLVENVSYFRHTGWNFFDWVSEWNFDILAMSRVDLTGLIAIVSTFALLFVGLYFAKQKATTRPLGIVTYPVLFFLYQIWWVAAVWAVIKRKKVKWR